MLNEIKGAEIEFTDYVCIKLNIPIVKNYGFMTLLGWKLLILSIPRFLVITLIYFYENHHIEDSNGLWVFIGRFEPSNHKSNRVIKVDFVHHC